MIDFPAHPDCRACDLWEGIKSPGLPTIQYRPASSTPKARALLVVGEAPGYQEDQHAEVWIGPTGKRLKKFIDACGFPELLDVYLTNANRCRPPKDDTPTAGRINKCRLHLLIDLRHLATQYGHENLIILCCGACAAHAVNQSTLAAGMRQQGRLVEISWCDEPGVIDSISIPTFYTYHPAITFAQRKPSLIRAISDHFNLLRRYILGAFSPPDTVPLPARAPTSPDRSFPAIVALDIETYGILAGQDQSVFHPAKSVLIDKCPLSRLVVSIAISYQLPDDPEIRTAFFLWPEDRLQFVDWIHKLHDAHATIVGKNLPFDLMYLRAVDDKLRTLLAPPLHFDDVAILNFLDYELRPERGLKPLSELLGVANYQALAVNAATESKALHKNDPDLALYNATDSTATLRLYHLLLAKIAARYGPSSAKLSQTCADHRHHLIWVVLRMSESGVCMSEKAIQDLQTRHEFNQRRLDEYAVTHYNMPLAGKGSQTAAIEAVVESLQPDLIKDRRVAWTKKTHRPSTKLEVINLILSTYPVGDARRLKPAILHAYRTSQKLVSSYTRKLLDRPREGLMPANNQPLSGDVRADGRLRMAYPSWFPVPGFASREATSDEGGTIQGRLSAQGPPAQTFPASVKSCITSRYGRAGCIVTADESQLELRVAALLSGDPVLMRTYIDNQDIHLVTGRFLFPDIDWSDPVKASRYRKVGKHINFLMLYRGGPDRLIATVRRMVGIEIAPDTASQLIGNTYRLYSVLAAWQQGLIESAIQHGYLELPTGWSRTFSGSRQTVLQTYVNEICNFPVQTIAAQLVQSAQYCIQTDYDRRCPDSRIALQEHDSIVTDCRRTDLHIVLEILKKHLTCPPLLGILEEKLGRTIPITCDIQVRQAHDTDQDQRRGGFA